MYMAGVKRVPKEIREEILLKVKEQGVSVKEVAKQYGIHHQTIYSWLTGNTSQMSLLEANKLKRENQMLTAVIGKLTIALNRQKKGGLPEIWL